MGSDRGVGHGETRPEGELADDSVLRGVPEVGGCKVLPPCALWSRIGEGGMGMVYRGRHLNLDIDVAVKCLRPSLALEGGSFVARFQREARLAAGVHHENLVHVYDVSEASGVHYLVMEHVAGESARERVERKGALAEAEAARIVLGAARGLAAAHRKKIVHRDVKPENVLISHEGEVKVADLGIAKALEAQGTATLTQGMIGTPQYMSPEQWEEGSAVGPAADVWALGATLYYLLAGENAIPGGAMQQVFRRVCVDAFPDVGDARTDLSPELAEILARCTARDPGDRYEHAGELARDLQSLLEDDEASILDPESGRGRPVRTLVSPPPAATLATIRARLASPAGLGADPSGGTATIGLDESTGPRLATRPPRSWRRAGIALSVLLLAAAGLVAGRWIDGWAPVPDEAGSGEEGVLPGERVSDAEGPEGEPAGGAGVVGETAPMSEGDRDPEGSGEDPAIDAGTEGGIEAAAVPAAPPRILLDSPPETARPYYTLVDELLISGRIETPRQGIVRLSHDGDEPVDYPLDEDGGFEISRGLGRNRTQVFELSADGLAEPTRIVVVHDSTDPEVTILSPRAGERTRDSSFDVVARVAEDHPDSVLIGPTPLARNEDGSWSLGGVALTEEGGSEFEIVATDCAGNFDRASFTITRDSRGPVLEAADPPDGAEVLAGSPLELGLTFDEEIRLASVEESVLEPSGRTAVGQVPVPSSRGPWVLEGVAEDALGNPTPVSLRYLLVVPDSSGPYLSEVHPREGVALRPGESYAIELLFDEPIQSVTVSSTALQIQDRRATGLLAVPEHPGPWHPLVEARDLAGNPFSKRLRYRVARPRFPDGWVAEREAGAGYAGLPKVARDPRTGLTFVLVAPGSFLMGSPETEEGREDDEGPQHRVVLSGFYLSKHPVTNEQYGRYLKANPGVSEPRLWSWKDPKRGKKRYVDPKQPVVSVTWGEATAYCEWANLVLPTEAQWEYACRAGTTTRFWSGDQVSDLDAVCWYEGNSGDWPYPVGRKPPNPLGLCDMNGNVVVWCRDLFGSYERPVREGDGERLVPGTGNPEALRAARGAGVSYPAERARSASRDNNQQGSFGTYRSFGIRPARALEIE